MAAVKVNIDLLPNKLNLSVFHFFLFYLPWSDGTSCHYLSFVCVCVCMCVCVYVCLFNIELQLAFSLSFYTLIKMLFSSSLSAIRVVSSAYLRLLIFLLAILIPTCASSSPAFLRMYSAYKLNKQGDNTGRMPFVNEGRDLSHTAERQGTPVCQQTPRC